MTTAIQPPGFEAAFRERLKTARIALRLTQAEVAQRAGTFGFEVGQPTIARIERGDRAIGLDEAAALALTVNQSLIDLILPALSTRPTGGSEVDRALREREKELELAAVRAAVAKAGEKMARATGVLLEGMKELFDSGGMPPVPPDFDETAAPPLGLEEFDQAVRDAKPAQRRVPEHVRRAPRTPKKKGAGNGRHHEV